MNERRIRAMNAIASGELYPYDAPDSWWNQDSDDPPVAKDWAHAAARGVIGDLKDRRGIKHSFSILNVDEDVRAIIVDSLAEIIRVAYEEMGQK